MNNLKKHIKLILNLIIPIIAILLVVILVPKLIVVFMPFFVGWVVSLIANPLVKLLEKRLKIVRKTGSAIVIVLVLIMVGLLFYGVFSGVSSQVKRLSKDVPTMAEEAKNDYSQVQDTLDSFYAKLPKDLRVKLTKATDKLSDIVMDAISNVGKDGIKKNAGSFVASLPVILIDVIVGFLAAYFFIAEKDTLEKFVLSKSNPAMRKQFRAVKVQLIDVLGGYFKAQFKIMAVVYAILVIGLGILQTPYFLLSALGIAFVDMLPFFGTGTILGPWAIIKILSGDYRMAIALVVLYGVTQLVRQLIQPKLLGDSMGLNPFATLFFMYLGFVVAGVLGMILAVPVAMFLINLYKSGVFDVMIYSAKELYREAKEFVHIDLPKGDE